MQAWILDESPGSYRYGEIGDPAVGPDDVRVRLGLRARFHEGVLEVDGNEARRLASWLQSRGYALDEDREPSPGNTPQGRS